jgi:hypothetical protein
MHTPACRHLPWESSTVASRDRITFEKIAEGTRGTYDADLALRLRGGTTST